MSDPRQLIEAYLEDSLSAGERKELTAWLKAHPDNLRAFVEANHFNEGLRAAVSSQGQREAAEAFAPDQGSLSRLKERWQRRMPSARHAALLPRVAFAAVALLLVVAVLVRVSPKSESIAEDGSWARIALVRSAQMAGPTPTPHAGQVIPPGRLVLLAGALELVLSNGVTIVFEGPGELELLTPMRALLHSGQAVVHVPEGAKGFRLETATAQVVDLGTEFGVKCGPGAVSDVFVFDGKVVASAPAGTAGFPRQLTAGTATRYTADQPSPVEIAYRPERFVRRLPAEKPVELDEPGSPLFNPTRFESVVVSRPERPVEIDGDLSEWSELGSFRSARNEVAGEFVEGRMRYGEECLYLAAHIGDPAPMRNVVDPATDGELGWRGGGLQVRLTTDSGLGWPAEGNSADYYSMRRLTADAVQVAKATNPHLVHLTLWHHAPTGQDCLHLAFGMDFHGGLVNPPGYRAAYRKDGDGRGYTLEYAIPWSLLGAARPPRPGETLAMSWTAHWSDEGGRLWRGQWVELRNPAEPLRIHTWERAATWGKAVFR